MEADKLRSVASTMFYMAQQQIAAQATTGTTVPVPAVGTDAQVVAQVSDQVSLTTSSGTLKNLDTAKTIEQIHASRFQVVKDVRANNGELARAAGQMNQLQANLTEIIKNYPPFPLDSSKRKDLLMSYTSIRQELIKMTVPAPPAPAYEKVRGMWSSLFGQNGQILHHAVPELHVSSSDGEIKAAATTLNYTRAKLATVSAGVTQALVQS